MSFRLAFPIAFLLLFGGVLGSRQIFASIVGGSSTPQFSSVASNVKHHGSTATPVAHRTRTATARTYPSPTKEHATATPHAVRHTHARPTATAPRAATARPTATAAPSPTPTPTPGVSPTPTATPAPTTGTVQLASYAVSRSGAAPGTTISVTYTIVNGTGRTERLELGASIKSSRSATWTSGVISDPGHDVVAIVPPGTSTHLRYFTVPSGARSGRYDVGWGLIDASTGHPVAFSASSGALSVG
jgi:hypothetical protein